MQDDSTQNKVDTHGADPLLDLTDPEAYELFVDDGVPGTDGDEQIRDAHKTAVSMDLQHQKGVEVVGERVRLPGRVPLWPVTLTQILFNVIGFSFGLIHFSIASPNYLLALFIFSGMMFMQTLIYHNSYRAMRTLMTVITVIGTAGMMAFVGWAYYDLIAYPPFPDKPKFLLVVSLVGFVLNALLMFVHLVFLGRGYRWFEIKMKKNPGKKENRAGQAGHGI